MKYLLDTCVISELIKAKPAHSVIQWFTVQPEQYLFLNTLVLAELSKGLYRHRLKFNNARTRQLEQWIKHVNGRFAYRTLEFGKVTFENWARLSATAEHIGQPAPVIDTLLVANALEHNAVIVTRNVNDFQQFDNEVKLINPFK
jgi:predicted nucleic acid-binding protein